MIFSSLLIGHNPKMDINNVFNQQRFEEYANYLKKSGLSDTSLKRKLSSLSSFQHFLLKRKIISSNEDNKNLPLISVLKNILPFKKKTD
jgi:site-specific recombinase XerD